MRFGPLFVLVAICVLPARGLWAQTSQAAEPIGRVTAAFGVAAVETPDGVRKGDLNTLIMNGDRVRTNGGGVTVLLASRVVLKIDHDTTIAITESTDQLNVLLEKGTVHVFVGERPLASGAVRIQDPHARAETVKGVFLASYDPATRSGYYACEHANLIVESADGPDKVTLSPDKQLVVVNGQLQQPEDLDRMTFAQRKQSLEQLGQAVAKQGAETFRIRSRMFDTQLAINQLSEAGWIDARTLQAQQQQKAAAKKKQSESDKKKSEQDNDESESKTDSSTSSPPANEEPAPTNETPADKPAAPAEPAPAEPSDPKPVLVDSTPAPAEPDVTIEVEPDAPAANAPAPSEPVAAIDLDMSAPEPTATGAPVAVDPPGNALGLDKQVASENPTAAVDVPKLDIEPPAGNDNAGPGNNSGLGNQTAVLAPPKADIDNPSRGKGPKLDLGLSKGNRKANLAPRLDVGRDAPAAPKIDLGGNAPPAPKIDLGGSAAPTPKLDLDVRSQAPAPTKIDLDLPTGDLKPGGISDSGAMPKIDLDIKPKLDLDKKGPGKIDLGLKDAAVPKLDKAGKGAAPVLDAPAPKLDVVDLPKTDLAAPAPKIDLDVQGAVPPAPKIDLGLPGATDAAVPPPAKIDLGLDAPTAGGTDGATPLPTDIKLPTDINVADVPKIDVDVKAPVPTDLKAPAPTDVVPKTDLQKATEVPPPKPGTGALSGAGDSVVTPAPVKNHLTTPRLELDTKALTEVAPPPPAKIDLSLDVPSSGDFAAPRVDLPAGDLKLDAPPKVDIPSDLTRDGLVSDLPKPEDLGVDVTTDTTTDGAKEAIDVVKDLTKDTHDEGGKGGKGKGKGKKGK